MTTATIALTELAEKGADIDVLRQIVQFMAHRLMELDVEGRSGAGYDEKSTERVNSRNGYRERTWDTRAGTQRLSWLALMPHCRASRGTEAPGLPHAATDSAFAPSPYTPRPSLLRPIRSRRVESLISPDSTFPPSTT